MNETLVLDKYFKIIFYDGHCRLIFIMRILMFKKTVVACVRLFLKLML